MVDIQWLISAGPCRKYAQGENIPCPGGPDESERAMYILLTGRVDVYKASAEGGAHPIGSLLPGDVFGGREYFIGSDDQIYKTALESVVFAINKDSFNDLSWSRPEILFDVLRASYMPLRAPQPLEEVRKPVDARTTVETRMTNAAGIFHEGHKHYPGIRKPEYLKLVFPKEYKCPLCAKTFEDYKIFRSKLYESMPMRYDLRRFYTGFQIEWYDVIVCRNCLFSTFSTYFTEPKPMRKADIDSKLMEAREVVHLHFNEERDIDYVFAAHYLALICAEGYHSISKQLRAKLWGNLSWLYEDVEDTDMMRAAAAKSAEEYEAIYAGSHLTTVQEQITCLSIAGMQYRAGIDRSLKKYLFTAKTIDMGDKVFAKLAEDFMYEMRLAES